MDPMCFPQKSAKMYKTVSSLKVSYKVIVVFRFLVVVVVFLAALMAILTMIMVVSVTVVKALERVCTLVHVRYKVTSSTFCWKQSCCRLNTTYIYKSRG